MRASLERFHITSRAKAACFGQCAAALQARQSSKDILCRASARKDIIKLRNERQLKNRSISVRENSWDSLRA
jgi:hypothetical protein